MSVANSNESKEREEEEEESAEVAGITGSWTKERGGRFSKVGIMPGTTSGIIQGLTSGEAAICVVVPRVVRMEEDTEFSVSDI